MKSLSVWIAACAVGALFGATPAYAFTIESYGSGTNGSQKFTDPDEAAPIQRLTNPDGSGKGLSFGSGDSRFNFSVQGNGGQSSGNPSAGTAFGSRNFNDPSQGPAWSSSNGPAGPFGMFRGH